jgi:hypothetical protein
VSVGCPDHHVIRCHSTRTVTGSKARNGSRFQACDDVAHAVAAIAKHKVVGSTPITRSQFRGKSRTSEDRSRPVTPGWDRSSPL